MCKLESVVLYAVVNTDSLILVEQSTDMDSIKTLSSNIVKYGFSCSINAAGTMISSNGITITIQSILVSYLSGNMSTVRNEINFFLIKSS